MRISFGTVWGGGSDLDYLLNSVGRDMDYFWKSVVEWDEDFFWDSVGRVE